MQHRPHIIINHINNEHTAGYCKNHEDGIDKSGRLITKVIHIYLYCEILPSKTYCPVFLSYKLGLDLACILSNRMFQK